MNILVSKEELENRMSRFREAMNQTCPDWDTALVFSKVNQYYFMGTMQDGMLLVKRDREPEYYVRRSFKRAKEESPLAYVYGIRSYRDAAEQAGADLGNVYTETEILPLAMAERLKKYFRMQAIKSLDKIILSLRAIKSPYELAWVEASGRQHNDLLQNAVPSLLKEGMNEAELVGALYDKMIQYGYHGVSRFSQFQSEMVVGQIGYGPSSLYPTSFDGPGGALGMYPAVPLVGSRENRLQAGDLVFVDIGFGINGYHSDKTQVYIFKGKATEAMRVAHQACMEIQNKTARLLKPGITASEVYDSVMQGISPEFQKDFMGFGDRQVKFLGHGVGLHVDELPVIASGFDVPLAENMVIALEPKKGIAGKGMVGVEETYIVEVSGGRCITGGAREIIEV